MIIQTLKVKGIGPFKDEIEIHPSELDEIVAITGRNGVGKTFLLETVCGGLYGYFPFRQYKQKGVTVYDFVAENQESYIEMIVHVGDRRFRIVRNFSLDGTWEGSEFKMRHQNQTAIAYEHLDGKWEPKAEKVGNTLEYVEENICVRQVFLSAMFNAQNSAGDLVDATADERKQIFASIIGLGGMQAKSELFSRRVKSITGIIDKLNTLIQAEESHVYDVEEINHKVTSYNTMIDTTEKEIAGMEKAREQLIAAKSGQQSEQDKVKNIDDRLDALQVTRTGLVDKTRALMEKARLVGSLKKKIEELDGLKKKRDELRATAEAAEAVNKKKLEKDREVAALRLKVKDARAEIERERAAVDKELSDIDKQIYQRKDSLNEWKRKSNAADLLDNLDCTKDCEYVADARAAVKWLGEMADTKTRIENDLVKLDEKLGAANVKAQVLTKKLDDKDYCLEERATGKSLIKEIDALKEEMEEFGDTREAFRKVEARISVLEGEHIHDRMSECKTAEAMVEEHNNRLDELIVEIRGLEDEKMEHNYVDYDVLLKNNATDIQTRKESLESYNANRQKQIAMRDESKKAAFKISIIEGKRTRLENMAGAYSQLSEAFSRSGIQALIIDAEKSTFLNIAHELFSILSGGALELNFTTTYQTKDKKKTKETFDLRLKVDGMERKLEQASQGQQDLARIVMRATLGIYFSTKTGNQVQSYFLDETTGSLDDLNREAYYDFLRYLLEYFKQIFVITHQDIAKQIPCHIFITDTRELEIT